MDFALWTRGAVMPFIGANRDRVHAHFQDPTVEYAA
jgi:hypothetical protein